MGDLQKMYFRWHMFWRGWRGGVGEGRRDGGVEDSLWVNAAVHVCHSFIAFPFLKVLITLRTKCVAQAFLFWGI